MPMPMPMACVEMGLWVDPSSLQESRDGRAGLNEVTTLSTERYEESPVGQIEPKWSNNLLGVHTLNHRGRLTVIDVLQKRWRWRR